MQPCLYVETTTNGKIIQHFMLINAKLFLNMCAETQVTRQAPIPAPIFRIPDHK